MKETQFNLCLRGRLCIWMCAVLFATSSCKHQVSVVSNPGDAGVYVLTPEATRGNLLGQTPLSIANTDLQGSNGIVVEKPGYESALIFLPEVSASDLDVNVALRPLDRDWVAKLPKDVAAGLHSEVLIELLRFQTELYSRPLDQLQVRIAGLKERFNHIAAFHYLMGNYWFYRDDFTAAAEAFSRAVELDPPDKHARDMLLVNQLRAAESSRAGNLKALEAVGIAARRIASNAGGMVAPTRSHPGLPDPDGLKIIIPSDPVFLPAQAKLRPDGLKLLQLVSKELKGLTKNFSVQISVHTDPDPRSEFEMDKPVLFKGKKASHLPWQLSGERAAGVMLYLRAQGILAQSWSIAGYGGS